MGKLLPVALLLTAGVAAGAALEYGVGLLAPADAAAGVSPQETALDHAVRHLDPSYVCPMHPEIVRDTPEACPICGMDLVAVGQGPAGTRGELPPVRIRPEIVHNLGVRTAGAERRTLWRRIDTVGYVEYDRNRLRHVYSPSEGSIENLTIRSEGERVRKHQFLFELDSPMLSDYYDKVVATRDGIVANLYVIEGTWTQPTDKVMTIADLASVWVLADVFEGQADWVKVGQSAEVRLPSVPGRVWEGKVEYIYPNLDPETRTLKVRMSFENPDEALKPNMLAEVVIYGGPKHDVLAIPRQALIETGKQQRVVLALGDGRFQPRAVTVGVERGDWVEVSEGLEEGEAVVVSGQFLIDSESNLQASLMRLQAISEAEEQE